ncbi:unnamed protein product [Phaeothamnion confervicola]
MATPMHKLGRTGKVDFSRQHGTQLTCAMQTRHASMTYPSAGIRVPGVLDALRRAFCTTAVPMTKFKALFDLQRAISTKPFGAKQGGESGCFLRCRRLQMRLPSVLRHCSCQRRSRRSNAWLH